MLAYNNTEVTATLQRHFRPASAPEDAENSPEPSKNKTPGTSPSATSSTADDSTPSHTRPPEETASAISTQDRQELVHALELEKQHAHYAEQQLHQAQQLIQAKQDTIDALKTTINALETTQQKQLTTTQEIPHSEPEIEKPSAKRRSPLDSLTRWLSGR